MTLPLRVNVAPERADASPGDNLQFDVTVRNASDIVEHYGVEMLGLPDGATVRAEPEVAKLRPAESSTLSVRVALPVQPPAPAGTYVVGALVRSKYRHDVSRCVEVPIELASVEQITLRTTPEVVTGGRTGQYTVEIANGGNAPVRLYLTATDPERRVNATFQPGWLDLQPGTSARALLNVSAPLPWNKEKQRQLTLSATPDLPAATPVTGTATFVQQPRIASKFAKLAGIAAAVIVLAAAIAVPTLLTRASQKTEEAAATQTTAPTGAATTPAQQQQSAAAAATSATSATSEAAAAEPSEAATTSAAPTSAAATVTSPTTVDLTTPPTGVVDSDFFRNQGFLVSADPGATAVTGCEDARSAAVVEDATGKFLTSSSADDATKCHEVPLLLDFLQDKPAGSVQVTPLILNTMTMEVTFRDFTRAASTTLTVSADDAKAHGGVDQVLIRSSSGAVAVTKLTFAPLS